MRIYRIFHHQINLLQEAYGHVFELARSGIKLVLDYDMVMDAKADNQINVCQKLKMYSLSKFFAHNFTS